MTNSIELAQRTPERKRHNWSQSVMHNCDFCSQWSLTVKREDGARICASCCDAEYTTKLEVANAALVEALEKAQLRISYLEAYSKTAIEFREAARDENRHLKLELEIAEKHITELEKVAAKPVAWTNEESLSGVGIDMCGMLGPKNAVGDIALYTVSPSLESRTVTVKLPERYDVETYPLQSPKGEWYSRDDVLATLAAAGIQVIEGEGQ